MEISDKLTTAEAEKHVENKEGKFISYGNDQKFFYVRDGIVYANRGKTYEVLNGNIQKRDIKND